ncbi:MAG TPA: hypothetical protein VFO55_11165 [Gemmatimonadaceae bacterium]|nr:hypothetical protein [Gemmatimonadaceae bacterium]
MNSIRKFSLRAMMAALSVALVATAVACTDRDVAESVAPPAPSAGRTMYLSLSKMAPAAGDEVVVSVNSRGAATGATVGSFKVRMSFDTRGLEFLGAVPQADGMVIANPVNDTLIIVGASGNGFATSILASVRMKVTDPAAVSSLGLEVVAVSTTDFASEASVTAVDRRLFRATPK